MKAQRPAYWKAENLDTFDGRAGCAARLDYSVPELPDNSAARPALDAAIRVARSATCARSSSSPPASRSTSTCRTSTARPTLDGLYTPSRMLRRGDTYTPTVYSPRPTEDQRRARRRRLWLELAAYQTIRCRCSGLPAISHVRVTFPSFGHGPHAARRRVRR